MRLLGFERVELKPGEAKTLTVKADPRQLARFDGKNGLGQWRITEGTYRVALGKSAGDLVLTARAPLIGRRFGSEHILGRGLSGHDALQGGSTRRRGGRHDRWLR
ncbi:MAG TPA: fibronectin type III-like domain-contianing protein [Vicinamibacterales bacterium]|nr:fibronectin type III-like domain-contianing protein [Vicinamibacterales bacterium]